MKKQIILTHFAIGVLIAFFAVFLILPVYTVVEEGVQLSLLREIFTNFIYRDGLLNSLKIAVVTTAFVFVIALPFALLYDRCEFPGKNWSHLAVMVPMILPPFARCFLIRSRMTSESCTSSGSTNS